MAEFHDFDTSWGIYLLLDALDWRFLPSELAAEPQWLMDDLVAIVSRVGDLEEMKRRGLESGPSAYVKPGAKRNKGLPGITGDGK